MAGMAARVQSPRWLLLFPRDSRCWIRAGALRWRAATAVACAHAGKSLHLDFEGIQRMILFY